MKSNISPVKKDLSVENCQILSKLLNLVSVKPLLKADISVNFDEQGFKWSSVDEQALLLEE